MYPIHLKPAVYVCFYAITWKWLGCYVKFEPWIEKENLVLLKRNKREKKNTIF